MKMSENVILETGVVAAGGLSGGALSNPAAVEKKTKNKAVGSLKASKRTVVSTHPPTQQMVDNAIKNLKERGGSSLPAIKKYINGAYNCDSQKLAPFIKKYLKAAVANGKLIQTKGKGASGSFKLSALAKKDVIPKLKKPETNDNKKKKQQQMKSPSAIISPVKSKKKSPIKASGIGIKKPTANNSPSLAKAKNTTGSALARKLNAEKKRAEKANIKNIKKTNKVKVKKSKAKTTTATKSTVSKTKVLKTKNVATGKVKMATKKAAAPKKASTIKKSGVAKK